MKNARPGTVIPQGRMRQYLKTIAEGWILRIVKTKYPDYYSAFWERTCGPGTFKAEEAGYVADAMLRLSYLVPESELTGEISSWIDRLFASQEKDGYLGCYPPAERWKHSFDIWSQDRILEALVNYYEATTDKRVFRTIRKAGYCLLKHLSSSRYKEAYSKPGGRKGELDFHSLNIVRALFQLYELLGDVKFKNTAIDLMHDFEKSEHIEKWGPGHHHIVTYSEYFSLPAAVCEYSGEKRLLKTSLKAYESAWRYHGLATGIISGNEYTYGKGPRKYTEHCGVIEWMITSDRLFEITGEIKYADAAERAMMNCYPASKSPDCLSLCYNHSPNELFATRWVGAYEDDNDRGMFRCGYSMSHEPPCCNANTSRGFPNFVDRAVKYAANGAIVLVYYGPMKVVHEKLVLELKTDYPFDDEVHIVVSNVMDGNIPIWLRIPEWTDSVEILVNSRPAGIKSIPGTFAKLNRKWSNGDEIIIKFAYKIRLERYVDSDYAVPGTAILRGALTYCLPIPEKWSYVGKEPRSAMNLTEGWDIVPAKNTVWQVALEINKNDHDASFKLVKLKVPKNSFPYEFSPIGLKVKARKVIGWQADIINGQPQTPALPIPPMKLGKRPFDITLVPFAFTRIRLTYLPVVGDEKRRVGLVFGGWAEEALLTVKSRKDSMKKNLKQKANKNTDK